MNERKCDRRVSTKGLCLQPDVARQEPAMRCLWQSHVQSCLRRDIPNLITVDDYAEMSQRNCSYCGKAPYNETKYNRSSNIKYNGVDRLDNTKGYTRFNTITCCKMCNGMKSGLDPDAFLQHVLDVADYTRSRKQSSST